MKGGMGRKQREALASEISAIPPDQPGVIIATGRYVREGFDDARLDTLFLAMPISWRGTLQQYVDVFTLSGWARTTGYMSSSTARRHRR
jgi:hypothetical protein